MLALIASIILAASPASAAPSLDPVPKGDWVLVERYRGRLLAFGPTSLTAVQVLIAEGGQGEAAQLRSLEPPSDLTLKGR